MENGAISDEQITASSQYTADHAPHQGRLHFLESAAKSGSWVAATGDANQWLQIDLRTLGTKVTRVATQGSNGVNHIEWVTNYMVQYCGNDGVTFHYYREQGETADKVQLTRCPSFNNRYSQMQINCFFFLLISIITVSLRLSRS